MRKEENKKIFLLVFTHICTARGDSEKTPKKLKKEKKTVAPVEVSGNGAGVRLFTKYVSHCSDVCILVNA